MGATANKYNSRINTFMGVDHYNLALGTTPPTDLSLSRTLMTTPYMFYRMGSNSLTVGFDKTDKPYIRSLGIFCNLADGLVDACAAHGVGTTGWSIRLQMERFGTVLTGAIANTAGSATVTGTSTLFTFETAVGQTLAWLDNNGITRMGVIAAIVSDTVITLSAVTASTGMFTGNTTAKTVYPMIGNAGTSIDMRVMTLNDLMPYSFFLGDVSKVHQPQGALTVTTGSGNVAGRGTAFTTDFSTGDCFGYLDDLGFRRTLCINTIASDIAMTVSGTAYSNATLKPFLNYDSTLRIRSILPRDFLAYMVTMDPLFASGSRRISIHTLAEIEHTSELTGTIS